MVKREHQQTATELWWNVVLLSALIIEGHDETNGRPRGNAGKKDF
jgi:hypothetical protein